VATFATGSPLVHENNLHLYNDKYLMYHLMNFMLKGVKSIPNDRYLIQNSKLFAMVAALVLKMIDDFGFLPLPCRLNFWC
jgi:hypothetical protein